MITKHAQTWRTGAMSIMVPESMKALQAVANDELPAKQTRTFESSPEPFDLSTKLPLLFGSGSRNL